MTSPDLPPLRAMPEDEAVIALASVLASEHALQVNIVRERDAPDVRLGLGFAASGRLDVVVARLFYQAGRDAVRVYTLLDARDAGRWGRASPAREGRMRSRLVYSWPADETTIGALVGASAAEARRRQHNPV
ncbi:hypothetical protein ABIE56_000333 [Luteibacter sp. 621]|uniref:hypothetical protein n=1 Tax=Luteibacter sp. 621 TaxID=3373916 RepID=UPI003D1E16EB